MKHKALSQSDYELAESKYRSADQHVRSLDFALGLLESSRGKRVAAAEAEVRQAEADVAKARWRLDNCQIRAPISGTILKKNAEEGNLVNPIAMNGSFSLCDLADLSDLEVELTIEERDISKVAVGQKCKVRTEAYPERIYEGVVSRLMPIADRNKAAIPVRVKVAVPQEEEGDLPEAGHDRHGFVLEGSADGGKRGGEERDGEAFWSRGGASLSLQRAWFRQNHALRELSGPCHK